MTELKIALWGAPGAGQAELADQLKLALKQLPALSKTTSDGFVFIEVFDVSASNKTRTFFDLNFLMGLELAASDPLAREKQSANLAIRAALTSTGTAYEVLYGSAQDRLAQALETIQGLIKKRFGLSGEEQSANQNQPARPNRPWVWACEKCSDPVCEHRLLTDLLAQRPAKPEPFTAP